MLQATSPPFVGRTQLQTVVRRIVRSDSAAIAECAHTPLYGGLGAVEARNSIHRLAGFARIEDRVLPWSAVVKKVAAPPSGSPAAEPGHPRLWEARGVDLRLRPAGPVA